MRNEDSQAPLSDPCEPATPKALGLWDAVSIIVGIVIGASVYEAAPRVLANVPGPWTALAVWAAGGALSLCGALCYAELATTFPQSGGDYVYLKRAYGPLLGFLFGWTQLFVVITASIGAMAFVFADYAVRLVSGDSPTAARVQPPELAVAAVIGLSLLNLLSTVAGRNVQNLLTAAKIVGLSAIVFVGLGWGSNASWAAPVPAAASDIGVAMILVLYTYGGWNDAAFVAAEVRDPRRNIPRALCLGVGCITAVYLLVNAAYIGGLGFAAARSSHAIAADTLALVWGGWGARSMCLLVMLSALGACNGLIFTGSRVYMRLGSEHPLFARLARWHPRLQTPVWSLSVQALVSVTMIVLVSTGPGQRLVNRLLAIARLEPAAWTGHGGFDTLVICSAPMFWLFFVLTGSALLVLRVREPDVERPFRVPLFPLLPLAFIAVSGWMLYSSLRFLAVVELLGAFLLLAVLPVATGLLLYLVSKRMRA
ncbi:MAG TPA: amino acid permease [Pirellulales bacterium]|jgi:amino acid transporter|nr:amino acid permease [Pirellulales bacterium]